MLFLCLFFMSKYHRTVTNELKEKNNEKLLCYLNINGFFMSHLLFQCEYSLIRNDKIYYEASINNNVVRCVG